MTNRTRLALPLAEVFLLGFLCSRPSEACCPAPPSGKPVVNADQTVILIWDAATKTQHFIRQASFKSQADDFGFLVPTPTQPELDEAGDPAFSYLRRLTEPEKKKVQRPSGGMGCGCAGSAPPQAMMAGKAAVRVLEEKLVAGLHAVVLEADSTTALVTWLKDNGYAFSPAVAAWAKPYVESGWKITALKVVKKKDNQQDTDVTASALHLTFKTDRPLFPYREPESEKSAAALGVDHRLLRIYFIAEARYQGEMTKEVPWTGKAAWSGKLSAEDRKKALEMLKLPETAGPAEWWLTEFEDDWPYRVAPADLYFSRDRSQEAVRRPPIIEYVASHLPTDVMAYALASVLVVPPLVRRVRRGRKQ